MKFLSILRGFEEGKEAVLIGKTLDKNIWQGWLANRNWWCPFNCLLGEDQVPRIC